MQEMGIYALLESRAYTFKLADKFYIEAHFNESKVNTKGFNGVAFSVRSLLIGIEITAVDLPGRTCFFELVKELLHPLSWLYLQIKYFTGDSKSPMYCKNMVVGKLFFSG